MNCRRVVALLLCLVCAGLGGCLDFGNDTEILAPEVTAQHLQQVTSLTGIRFPDGATGLAYLYLGSGIDDALAAKVAIPADQKDVFVRNEIFRKGNAEPASIQIGKLKAWWGINALTERTDRTLQLPSGRHVECTLGIEDGRWVVYISWLTT